MRGRPPLLHLLLRNARHPENVERVVIYGSLHATLETYLYQVQLVQAGP